MRQLKASSELPCHFLAKAREVLVTYGTTDSQAVNHRNFYGDITGVALLIPLASLLRTESRESVGGRCQPRGGTRTYLPGSEMAREKAISFIATLGTECNVDRRGQHRQIPQIHKVSVDVDFLLLQSTWLERRRTVRPPRGVDGGV